MPFTFRKLPLKGLLLIEPKVFYDERGFFMETYKHPEFFVNGVRGPFVQDNHSCSKRGVLRGLHFQKPPRAQGKLVRVIRGVAWDVAVDLRKDSPTFGKWYGTELSEENHYMLWVPEGFAHGFLALDDDTEVQYKCTAVYHPQSEGGVRWDDPDINIKWPNLGYGIKPIVSPKDAELPFLRDLEIPSTWLV
ncbi:MAG: dTDP-4-dehydrorhamnose 3,5-epimerase [Spirochaetes bacterium]|nr:dTDP-4-dehydrorhamnose 3,5-epimerase [Spirochaetota bacterium]